MEATARIPVSVSRRLRPGAAADLATSLLSASTVVYLSLSNGGYEVTERSEIGVIVWWILLLGTLTGALVVTRSSLAGRVLLALLTAFVAWSALSLAWTESEERTMVEVARNATYLGVFALALCAATRDRWRHLLNGITLGVAVVVALALLSRLEPSWFPDQGAATAAFPGGEHQGRLSYPLNYAGGIAALGALSLPLLLGATATARTVAIQAFAAAALPVAALTLWFTASGFAIPLAAIGIATFLLLSPDRLPKLATVLVVAAGSAVLIAAAAQREALDQGFVNAAGQQEGDEMLAFVLVVCGGVALCQAAISLGARYARRPAWMHTTRRQASLLAVPIAVGGIAIAVIAGAPHEARDAWNEFRFDAPTGADTRGEALLSTRGGGRYEFWRAAIDANASEPLLGIGPGTFEFWWSREGETGEFVRDAHSLYLETLGELGIVGLLLIAAAVLTVLGVGVVRALRAPPTLRTGIAAATGAAAVFAVGAGMDWFWELAVLPIVFFALAPIALAAGSRAQGAADSGRMSVVAGRAATAIAAVACLVAIVIPLASTGAVNASRASAEEGRLDAALQDARAAERIQPWAATPTLQEALLLEAQGDLDGAAAAARQATAEEPTNWRTWLVLSRIETYRGNAQGSVAAYREARELHPTSPLFTR
jgi:hypothetical protein